VLDFRHKNWVYHIHFEYVQHLWCEQKTDTNENMYRTMLLMSAVIAMATARGLSVHFIAVINKLCM